MRNRTLIAFAIVNKHPIQSKLPRGRIRSGSQCEGTGHHSQGGMFFFVVAGLSGLLLSFGKLGNRYQTGNGDGL